MKSSQILESPRQVYEKNVNFSNRLKIASVGILQKSWMISTKFLLLIEKRRKNYDEYIRSIQIFEFDE